MSIPKHNEIRIPALDFLSKKGKTRLKDFEKTVAL